MKSQVICTGFLCKLKAFHFTIAKGSKYAKKGLIDGEKKNSLALSKKEKELSTVLVM